MTATMRQAADALNAHIAKMGDGWTWTRTERGYVLHQTPAIWSGLDRDRYVNPRIIGTTATEALAYTRRSPADKSDIAMLAEYGLSGIEKLGYSGVIDRLHNSGLLP